LLDQTWTTSINFTSSHCEISQQMSPHLFPTRVGTTSTCPTTHQGLMLLSPTSANRRIPRWGLCRDTSSNLQWKFQRLAVSPITVSDS
jgi:hypothetical protein